MRPTLLITVDVEEWYHSNWFDIEKIKGEPPALCAEGVAQIVGLFKRLNVRATFFFLGEIVEKYPELVEEVVSEGHEVACHGHSHAGFTELERPEVAGQIKRAKKTIESIAKERVLGYRAPNYGINPQAISILADLGFRYDSSVVPCLKIPGWYGNPFAPMMPYRLKNTITAAKRCEVFWEIPIAVSPILRIPAGGGWFLRNLGATWVKFSVKALSKRGPVTLYMHPWEFSDVKPSLDGIPFHVFRRTGRYVREAITSIVKDLDADSVTIAEFLRENDGTGDVPK
jgi:polysaccharide deacetylase family protein (PEP-CTERM system associated)